MVSLFLSKFSVIWCVFKWFGSKVRVLLWFVVGRCIFYKMLLFVWCFRVSVCFFVHIREEHVLLIKNMNICRMCRFSLKNIKMLMRCVVCMIVSKENMKKCVLVGFQSKYENLYVLGVFKEFCVGV